MEALWMDEYSGYRKHVLLGELWIIKELLKKVLDDI